MVSAILPGDVILVLLWQPAITVAELKPQQNIIAVLVDDSRSMAIADQGGISREAEAQKVLQDGTLAELQKRFQTRIYRLDTHLTRVSDVRDLQAPPAAPATRIADSLKQLAAETSDLPVGAVVLLSDGSDNAGASIWTRFRLFATGAFRFIRLDSDSNIFPMTWRSDDAVVAPRALTDSRLSARVSFHQHGYSGRKSTLSVRDGDKVLASREITFGADDKIQTESMLFSAGSAGASRSNFQFDRSRGTKSRE